MIRPVDDVVERHLDVEVCTEFNAVKPRKDACHVKLTAAEQIAEIERKCLGVVGEIGDFLVHRAGVSVGLFHIGVAVAVCVDCFVCAVRKLLVLQIALAREALQIVLCGLDVVAVAVNDVERAGERCKLIGLDKFSVTAVLDVIVARDIVESFVDGHIDAVNVSVNDAVVCVLSCFYDFAIHGRSQHISVFRTRNRAVVALVDCIFAACVFRCGVRAVAVVGQIVSAVFFCVILVAVNAFVKTHVIFVLEILSVVVGVIVVVVIAIEACIVEDSVRALLHCQNVFFSAEVYG